MKKAFFYFFLLFSVLTIPLFVHAAATITLSPKIPGMSVSPTTGTPPSSFVAGFYKFALMIGGTLAFGAVVYGGILYAASAGNPGKQSEGREWIKSALFGLLLLAGAYLILYTVNPDIVSLSLPGLPGANVTGQTGGGGGGGTPSATGCAGGSCQTLANCNQTAATTGPGAVNCGASQTMATLMQCVQTKDPSYAVAEGYPPAVGHEDKGHSNGCAIDVHVTGSGSTCSQVAAMESAITACGGGAYDEYSGCSDSKNPASKTGNNLHIDAPKKGGC